MPLIKDGRLIDDPWTPVADTATLPAEGALLVSYATWTANREALLRRNAPLGIRLESNQSPALIADDLDRFDLIALDIPVFKDGRAYSYARLLRERYGYAKELRAVGNVLRDQYSFLHRCGFDTFEVADDAAVDAWWNALSEISHTYQPAADSRRSILALRQASKGRPVPPQPDAVTATGGNYSGGTY